MCRRCASTCGTGAGAARPRAATSPPRSRSCARTSPATPTCPRARSTGTPVDELSVATLQAVQSIAAGEQRSYEALRTDADARTRGLTLGANPLAIVVPCHRVTRGREITGVYVGGAERKHLLRQHERR